MYFYPKEGESEKYEGGRSKSDLTEYLIKNSSAYRKAFPNEKVEGEEETSEETGETEDGEEIPEVDCTDSADPLCEE